MHPSVELHTTTNGYVWPGGDFNARFVEWTSLEVSPAAGSERPQNQKLGAGSR